MPKIDREFAQRLAGAGLDLPVEVATPLTPNDMLLSRMLSHQLRLIDLIVVRQYGMYNEGLSYHHSYQPSVDRMVRRMQLFTQQSADYPSFFGVNYSWFPAMFGYVEGGVPTDAHAGERNRVLGERVEAAGFVGLSAEERRWFNEHRNDLALEAQEKVLQLQERAVGHWKKQHELGWGQHNQLYNNAVRAVKQDAACTLFENAGHNEGKSTREMFRDMNAVCYESYTDFGDWPMSSGFVVDWSKGNAPGQPVWLTTCWGASSEGKMKSLLHAFARGMEGGGVPLQATFELPELARLGTGMKFLSQYGALTTHAGPDRRLAILSRASKQVLTPRGMWQYHVIYSYLTRLGFPPVLVADDEVAAQGIPDHVQVLALVQEQNPLEKLTLAAIEKFQARGGKVLSIGTDVVSVPGSLTLEQPVKHIWDFSGFHADVHGEMWAEFQHWQAPLEKLLGQSGLTPLATTDSNRGYVLTMDAGPVRYLAVIADAAGKHSNEFVHTSGLEVSVEGSGWLARDLVKQIDLPTKAAAGRTVVTVDLITEPTTLVALYRAAPATVETLANSTPTGKVQAGRALRLQGVVSDARQQPMIGVPVSLTLVDAQGNERGQWYRGANDVLEIPVARHAPVGQWQLAVQELLTGVTSVARFEVTPAEKPTPTAVEIADVHRVNEAHLQAFARRPEEKLIIVESNQREFLPMAEKLAAAITSAGIPARVWQVQQEEFDTIPQRWFPRAEDSARYEQIAAGKMIGYRKNMEAYIDRLKQSHVPKLGGYGDIEPNYLVGKDCIVFSGGCLAESLRAATAWMETPHIPGRGQGRLVVCFSPFAAGKQVTAIVANDLEGISVAAKSLADTFTSAQPQRDVPAEVAKVQPSASDEFVKLTTGDKATRVPQPYQGYTPIQRVQRLLTTRTGQATLLLEGDADNLAFVDPAGKIVRTAKLSEVEPKLARLDDAGRLVMLHKRTLEKHPGWGFATSIEYTADRIDQRGQRVESQVAYRGRTSALPPDYESAFQVARGADSVVYPRFGGLMFRSAETSWQYFDDLPFARRMYEVLFPRMPISVHFSPDGNYALISLETRPPFGAFSQPPLAPTSAETMLLDMKTGESIWALRGEDDSASTYSVHAGFAAVAKDGQMTAMTDYNGVVYLVDRTGKIVLRQQAVAPDRQAQHIGPPAGIGTAISDDGQTAIFAFQSQVIWANARGESLIKPLAGVAAAALAGDGSLALIARTGGELVGMAPNGETPWSKSFGPTRLDLAAVEEHDFLVATGTGELVKLSATGETAWKVNVAEAADAGKHPVTDAADLQVKGLPDAYREPDTLSVALKQLNAKPTTTWKPTGESREFAGKKFYTVAESIQLTSDKTAKECFVHLVYHRGADNQKLLISTKGPDGSETFELDLPTPTYRTVDIPVRGPAATVTISSEGPVEIAECVLYSLKFPGQNLAYFAPAGSGLEKKTQPKESPLGDDLLTELTGESEDQGAIKTCRIWWPNSDPDAIAGPFLRAPLDPTQMVDGKRFGAGKVNPWSNKNGNNNPTRGAFFTVDFGQPKSFSLLATYDRATKQSEVSRNVAVFSTADREHDFLATGQLLAGAEENDQFWRLIRLPVGEASILGVHVFRDETSPTGLSEIEVYK